MCNIQHTYEKMLSITEFKSKPQDTTIYNKMAVFFNNRDWQFYGNIKLLIYTREYVKITLSCEKLLDNYTKFEAKLP